MIERECLKVCTDYFRDFKTTYKTEIRWGHIWYYFLKLADTYGHRAIRNVRKRCDSALSRGIIRKCIRIGKPFAIIYFWLALFNSKIAQEKCSKLLYQHFRLTKRITTRKSLCEDYTKLFDNNR